MGRTLDPRTKQFKIFLTEGEYNKVKIEYEKSMCKTISEYGRRMLFRETIKVKQRNRSADDAVETNIEVLQVLRGSLSHPSLSNEDKYKIIAGIEKIEFLTNKIFCLCSQE